MEIKNVKNKIIIFFIILIPYSSFCQSPKYLLFDNNKDSIVKIGNIKYYKIDNNLFDLNRYNKIDTISKEKVSKKKITSVEKLWKEGKNLFSPISESKNLIIETYNEIFEYIYILENTNNCSLYKRTRVWWIDY